MLLVAPLSGHHATLLRDTVRALLPEHDVWITDWVDARMVPLTAGPFHLADYVDYVREFITLLTDPRQPNLNVISVCQPTVPVLCAVALMAQDGEAQSAEDDGDDGRADRRAEEPDRGQQPRHAQALFVVRAERDPARAGRSIRATCGASTRASCSTSASWR